MKILVQNRKARHNYQIESSLEMGIQLVGSEVKSLRLGQGSLLDAFAYVRENELFLGNLYIPPYSHRGYSNHQERRERKLLAHKREIRKLSGASVRQGYTLIPLQIYLNKKGLIKVQLALAKGATKVDKRQNIKERDWKRQQERLLKKKH
jgi:SsrA-binding protein